GDYVWRGVGKLDARLAPVLLRHQLQRVAAIEVGVEFDRLGHPTGDRVPLADRRSQRGNPAASSAPYTARRWFPGRQRRSRRSGTWVRPGAGEVGPRSART